MGPIRIGGPSYTPIDGPGAHIFVDLDVPIIICARNVNTAILIGEAFFLRVFLEEKCIDLSVLHRLFHK